MVILNSQSKTKARLDDYLDTEDMHILEYYILIPSENNPNFQESYNWGEDENIDQIKPVLIPSKKFLDKILFNLNKITCEKKINDISHVFGEALLNAFWWGNKLQDNSEVDVIVFETKENYALRIIDFGKGFDYFSKINDYFNRLPYSSRKINDFYSGGNGINLFAINYHCNILYEGNGNILNILIPKDCPQKCELFKDKKE